MLHCVWVMSYSVCYSFFVSGLCSTVTALGCRVSVTVCSCLGYVVHLLCSVVEILGYVVQ